MHSYPRHDGLTPRSLFCVNILLRCHSQSLISEIDCTWSRFRSSIMLTRTSLALVTVASAPRAATALQHQSIRAHRVRSTASATGVRKLHQSSISRASTSTPTSFENELAVRALCRLDKLLNYHSNILILRFLSYSYKFI
jgi:hypothetical protein